MALKVYDQKTIVINVYILHSLSRTLWRIIEGTKNKRAFLHEFNKVWFIEHLLSTGSEIDAQFSQLH